MPNSAARLRSHVSNGVGTFVSISFAGCARLSKPSEMVSCAVFRWSARSVPMIQSVPFGRIIVRYRNW